MNDIRNIKKVLKGQPTLEGAGVHLKRAFGFNEAPALETAFREYREGSFIKAWGT